MKAQLLDQGKALLYHLYFSKKTSLELNG